MTKAEYMGALRDKLDSFNSELQQEIMEDYEQHFAEGLAAGKTEEEIIEELGEIEDMIRELPEEDAKKEIGIHEEVSEKDGVYEGDYKAVVIEGLLADISLRESEDGSIRVDYRNEGGADLQQRYRFFRYEEDGVLHVGIKDCVDSGDFGGAGFRKKVMLFGKTLLSYHSYGESGRMELAVEVPTGIGRVEATAASGSVKVNGVSVGRLQIRTVSGEAEVSGLKGEALELKTGSGEIRLCGILEQTISLHTVSGDIEGNGILADSLDGGTASGDLTLTELKGRSVRLNTASGDIQADNMAVGEIYAGTGSGDVRVSGGAEKYVVKTGSGDVELQTEGEVQSVQIETGSGDVKLKLTGTAAQAEIHGITGSGDCVIYGADGEKRKLSFGSCTVGNGDCKVHVRTGSGDAEIRCRA